jgi:effector-binding domain-containing protein
MDPGPVEIGSVAAVPTAVIREVTTWGLFPGVWPALLSEVYGFVRGRPEFASGDSGPRWHNVMLYLDQRPEVEIGVLVPAPFTPAGRIRASTLPGGRVARATHRGDYARLGATHAAVHTEVERRGLTAAGPCWEVYGHACENPDDQETEIFHLLV